jgi:hypothetical protein
VTGVQKYGGVPSCWKKYPSGICGTAKLSGMSS